MSNKRARGLGSKSVCALPSLSCPSVSAYYESLLMKVCSNEYKKRTCVGQDAVPRRESMVILYAMPCPGQLLIPALPSMPHRPATHPR